MSWRLWGAQTPAAGPASQPAGPALVRRHRLRRRLGRLAVELAAVQLLLLGSCAVRCLSFEAQVWQAQASLPARVGTALVRGLLWDGGARVHPDERFLLSVSSRMLAAGRAGGHGGYLAGADSAWNPYTTGAEAHFAYGQLPLSFSILLHAWFADPAEGMHWFMPEAPEGMRVLIAHRLAAVGCDALAVLACWLAARMWLGRAAGLLAMLLAGLCPLLLEHARVYTVDAGLTCLSAWSCAWLSLAMRRPRAGVVLLAAIATALAVACKLAALALLAGWAVWAMRWMGASLRRRRPARLRRAVAGCAALALLVGMATLRLAWPAMWVHPADWQSLDQAALRELPELDAALAAASPAWVSHTQGPGMAAGLLVRAGLWPARSWERAMQTRVAEQRSFTGLPYFYHCFHRHPVLDPLAALSYAWGPLVLLGMLAGLFGWTAPILRTGRVPWRVLLFAAVSAAVFVGVSTGFVRLARYYLPATLPAIVLTVWLLARTLPAVWGRLRPSNQTPGSGPAPVLQAMRDGPSLAGLRTSSTWAIGLLLTGLLAWQLLHGIGYLGVWTASHPLDRAARWISQNAPPPCNILVEYWDESLGLYLPMAGAIGAGDRPSNLPDDGLVAQFLGQTGNGMIPAADSPPGVWSAVVFDPFSPVPDSAGKIAGLAERLARSDLVVLSSDRGFANVGRRTDLFPFTANYYGQLLSGLLGFRPVAVFSRPAGLLGWDSPAMAGEHNLRVFNRPAVVILQRDKYLPLAELERRILSMPQGQRDDRDVAALVDSLARILPDGQLRPALADRPMRPYLLAVQWYGLGLLAAMLAWPVFWPIFARSADAGWAMARVAPLPLCAMLAWWTGSLAGVWQGEVVFGAVAVLGVAAVLLSARRHHAWAQAVSAYGRRALVGRIVVVELVALGLLLGLVWIRSQNPAPVGPFLGEKPIELACFQQFARGCPLPPDQVWAAGATSGYYQLGWLAWSIPGWLLNTPPREAFNLAMAALGPWLFLAALAATGMLTRRWWLALCAALALTVMGNLAWLAQLQALGLSVWGYLLEVDPAQWWTRRWDSSRVTTVYHAIQEYPQFSLLHGDLHPHVMAMPFSLVALACMIRAALRGRGQLAAAALAGLFSAAAIATNAWDAAFLMAGGASIAMARAVWTRTGRGIGRLGSLTRRARSAAPMALTACIAAVSLWPLQGLPDVGKWGQIQPVPPPAAAPLDVLLTHGALLAPLLIWLICIPLAPLSAGAGRPHHRTRPWQRPVAGAVCGLCLATMLLVLLVGSPAALAPPDAPPPTAADGWSARLLAHLLAPSPATLLLPLALGLAACGILRFRRTSVLPLLLALAGLGLLALSDAFEFYERMNTVFKLGLLAGLLLAVAGCGLLADLLTPSRLHFPSRLHPLRRHTRLLAFVPVASVAALVLLATLPIHGHIRAVVHFPWKPLPHRLSLDPAAHLVDQSPDDAMLIEWLATSPAGTVVAEAPGGYYTHHARTSSMAGVRTALGWSFHAFRHGATERSLEDRQAALSRLFTHPDASVRIEAARQLGVHLVVFSQAEREQYGLPARDRLDRTPGLIPAFRFGHAYAWAVLPRAPEEKSTENRPAVADSPPR